LLINKKIEYTNKDHAAVVLKIIKERGYFQSRTGKVYIKSLENIVNDMTPLDCIYCRKMLDDEGADYYENKDKATLDKSIAKKIDRIGVTYPNLVSDERFKKEVKPMMRNSFPGTWVVDSEGKFIDFISGGKEENEWRALFDEWLAKAEGK